ncbi:hypothetical protein E3N88_07875 [Mikania micrantha]|uniref:Uncharacterized protein n=1 Tax=Mikania micrantha TaxID=192012 RepID=A0A5N6PEL1_9ASTR|nr:hypothetical protein E3N88_07875 [Mikania micrantha]
MGPKTAEARVSAIVNSNDVVNRGIREWECPYLCGSAPLVSSAYTQKQRQIKDDIIIIDHSQFSSTSSGFGEKGDTHHRHRFVNIASEFDTSDHLFTCKLCFSASVVDYSDSQPLKLMVRKIHASAFTIAQPQKTPPRSRSPHPASRPAPPCFSGRRPLPSLPVPVTGFSQFSASLRRVGDRVLPKGILSFQVAIFVVLWRDIDPKLDTSMEESAQRRERLKVMRMEASQEDATFNIDHSAVNLSNPFLESTTNSQTTSQSFNYYTNQMAAYSGNKRSQSHGPTNRIPHLSSRAQAPTLYKPTSIFANAATTGTLCKF